MGKETTNSNLEELEQALDVFCASEYSGPRIPMTGKDFTLYAKDGGEYCVNSDVNLTIRDGEFLLTIPTKINDYKVLESKTFKLVLEDE